LRILGAARPEHLPLLVPRVIELGLERLERHARAAFDDNGHRIGACCPDGLRDRRIGKPHGAFACRQRIVRRLQRNSFRHCRVGAECADLHDASADQRRVFRGNRRHIETVIERVEADRIPSLHAGHVDRQDIGVAVMQFGNQRRELRNGAAEAYLRSILLDRRRVAVERRLVGVGKRRRMQPLDGLHNEIDVAAIRRCIRRG
jgi:hypothetical protein